MKIDRSKLMENKDGNWTTAGNIPFIASESKATLLHIIKKYKGIRHYKQLSKIDNVYFYGNPGDSKKLKAELIEKEIIYLPMQEGDKNDNNLENPTFKRITKP